MKKSWMIGCAAGVAFLFAGFLTAQNPQPPATPAVTPFTPAAPVATLNQLMRVLFFPDSNVVFFPQRYDPATVKQAQEPSGSTDPLTGVFGGWQAVENAALTLADSADLMLIPGRKCSNGVDVPVTRPDWIQLVGGLRDASLAAYKLALTKNMEKMTDASAVLADSCAACHGRYRPGAEGAAGRCMANAGGGRGRGGKGKQ